MSSLPEFLLKITKATNLHKEAAGAMSIIIRQPYIWLEKELGRAFKGQEDVKVIVDRRCAERRTGLEPVAMDRRKADRRGANEELVEVVISI